MRSLLVLIGLLLITNCTSQENGIEVFLMDYSFSDESLSISNLVNVSNNPGYDNQPSFSPNGDYLLFASTRDGQTDIRKYDLSSSKNIWLTNTTGSEYSPTVMPDGSSISAISLETDGEQLLWEFSLEGDRRNEIVIEEVIGYHTWYDADNLYTFVLADALNPNSTLVHFELSSMGRSIIAENIGRSLHRVPQSTKISFIDKSTEPWTIKSFDHKNSVIEVMAPTLPEVEDMTWLNADVILMGSGPNLYTFNLTQDNEWQLAADLSDFGIKSISRISINPKSSKIALVSE